MPKTIDTVLRHITELIASIYNAGRPNLSKFELRKRRKKSRILRLGTTE